MKIVHLVSGGLDGGAARGALNLHNSLLEKNIDSVLLSNNSNNESKKVMLFQKSPIQDINFYISSKVSSLSLKMYPKRKGLFSNNLIGYDVSQSAELVDADIVHLHWINKYVSLQNLKKIKKPIIWTIRDMWPFTGGCHYSIGCEKYKKKCGSCPVLKSSLNYDLSTINQKAKKNFYRNIDAVVGISPWITEQIKSSGAFKNSKIDTIMNGIDLNSFYNEKQSINKSKNNKKIILIGASNHESEYKGSKILKEALQQLKKGSVALHFFGSNSKKIFNDLDVEQVHHGVLNSDKALRKLYNSADVFVCSSIQEAFGKTVVESMACGLPVVCFNNSGPKDIVAHKKTGYLAELNNKNDLINGIQWLLHNKDILHIKNNAVVSAQNYNISKLAEKYISLYKNLMRQYG